MKPQLSMRMCSAKRSRSLTSGIPQLYPMKELLSLLRDLFQATRNALGRHHQRNRGHAVRRETYSHRFKSLHRAYELVGFNPERDYSYLAINRALRAFHREHLVLVMTQLESAGAYVKKDPITEKLLRVNDEFTCSLSVGRCRELRDGEYRWLLRFDTSLAPDITIRCKDGSRQRRYSRLLSIPEHRRAGRSLPPGPREWLCIGCLSLHRS